VRAFYFYWLIPLRAERDALGSSIRSIGREISPSRARFLRAIFGFAAVIVAYLGAAGNAARGLKIAEAR
jgi:hypothetical protein